MSSYFSYEHCEEQQHHVILRVDLTYVSPAFPATDDEQQRATGEDIMPNDIVKKYLGEADSRSAQSTEADLSTAASTRVVSRSTTGGGRGADGHVPSSDPDSTSTAGSEFDYCVSDDDVRKTLLLKASEESSRVIGGKNCGR